MARFNTDGNLDPGFGGDGIVITSIPQALTEASDVAIQPVNGKIVVAGRKLPNVGINSDMIAVRYNTDGSLDSSFSPGDGDGSGIATINVNGDDEAQAVAIQPADGAIVLAGDSDNRATTTVVRLTSTGALDPSFDGDGGSGNGIVTFDVTGSSDVADDVALEPDGQIVTSGFAHNNATDDDFALARLNSDGTLDTASDATPTSVFDTDGKLTIPVSTSYDEAGNVAVQTDGKIVASGEVFLEPFNATSDDVAVVRVTDSGALDTSFDGPSTGNGIVVTSLSSGDDGAWGMALDGTTGSCSPPIRAPPIATSR